MQHHHNLEFKTREAFIRNMAVPGFHHLLQKGKKSPWLASEYCGGWTLGDTSSSYGHNTVFITIVPLLESRLD
jgi:hypothetical protein